MNREQLLRKRAELQQRLDAIARDYREGLDADSDERATQMENDEVLAEIARICRVEIAEIDRLLAQPLKNPP